MRRGSWWRSCARQELSKTAEPVCDAADGTPPADDPRRVYADQSPAGNRFLVADAGLYFFPVHRRDVIEQGHVCSPSYGRGDFVARLMRSPVGPTDRRGAWPHPDRRIRKCPARQLTTTCTEPYCLIGR